MADVNRDMLRRHGIDYRDGITRTPEPLVTQRVKREVIEGRLLAALDDKSKVAIVASEDDLALLIAMAKYYPFRTEAVLQMEADLTKLQATAFPV